MEIIPVSRMDEVLARALTRNRTDRVGMKRASSPVPAPAAVEVDEEASVLTAH